MLRRSLASACACACAASAVACGPSAPPAIVTPVTITVPTAPSSSGAIVVDPRLAPASPSADSEDAPIPIDTDDPRVGDRQELVTLVVFLDLACPACGAMFDEMIAERHAIGPVRVVYKHYPLRQHPAARPLAEAAQGAFALGGPDAFLRFVARAIHAGPDPTRADMIRWATEGGAIPPAPYEKGLASGAWAPVVERDLALGERLALVGVPTIYANCRLYDQAKDGAIAELVAEERAKAEAEVRARTARADIYAAMCRANTAR